MYILHENTLGLLDLKLSLAENTCGLGKAVDKQTPWKGLSGDGSSLYSMLGLVKFMRDDKNPVILVS